jgi:hypothetical protein
MRPFAIKHEGKPAQVVPCGKCIKCLARRSASWAFRLEQEQKQSTSSCFITLTYKHAPISQNGYPNLIKSDFQNFLKKLRKNLKKSKLKYYAVGEYGTQFSRPHYHAIMFNLPQSYLQKSQILTDIWGHGLITIDPCNPSTMRYTTNYLQKPFTIHSIHDDRQKHFSLMSKGMGANYLTPQKKKYHRENLISHVTLSGGTCQAMPRYYRDKIFDDEMKSIINEHAELVRDYNFEKLFNSNSNIKLQWKQQQRKQHQKQMIQKRIIQPLTDSSTLPMNLILVK